MHIKELSFRAIHPMRPKNALLLILQHLSGTFGTLILFLNRGSWITPYILFLHVLIIIITLAISLFTYPLYNQFICIHCIRHIILYFCKLGRVYHIHYEFCQGCQHLGSKTSDNRVYPMSVIES